ncbi:MAG: glucosaminidase domain-containing protein [Flavobacteriales bacterium]|nr:glucosaminidase domain-containing protein [Flavobacteriales bacterium]
MKRFATIFLVVLLTSVSMSVYAQPADYKNSPEEYIEKYKSEAIKEMLMNGVPASITLSQGMLESANGNGPLAIYANNHFGIKCHRGWDGLTFIQDDDTKDECFRRYTNVLDSYHDHSKFLSGRGRYASLFDLKVTDYKGWARGLKKAGYATNPRYPQLLIILIERHKLYEYDKVKEMPALMPEPEEMASKPVLAGRKVLLHNRVKYIIVKDGDTYFEIASNLDMMLWQIYKYNDLKKQDKLRIGQVIYLQPKRGKAKRGYDYHIAKRGETLYAISQKYAVKIKSLYRLNRMVEGSQPDPGQRISLRKVISAQR